MILGKLDARFLLVAGIAVAGCECGDSGLLDARARLVVMPAALEFGSVTRGELRVMSVALSNSGSSALHITKQDIAPVGGEFAFVSPVPEGLAPQQSVEVAVAYEPADLGEDSGTITFQADDGNDPIIVTLHGFSGEGRATATVDGDPCNGVEGSIAFGNVRPGMSAEHNITVKSEGTAPIDVLSAVIEPGTPSEFSIDASALPKTLAPNEQLVLVARYTPTDGGDDAGAFVITTSSPATPSIRVPICGTGVAPAIRGTPVPLDLGSHPDGASATGRLTLESSGLEPLEITAIALANDAQHMTSAGYRLTTVPSLPVTLQPGATIEVEVTFDARLPFGEQLGWIEVQSNALGNTQAYFPLTARVATPCTLFVAPMTVSFRAVPVGPTGTSDVLIGNAGESDCSIAALTVVTTAGGGMLFALSAAPATPFTLGSGMSQTVTVSYTPVNAGVQDEGVLTIEDAAGGTHPVMLFGNPPEATGCVVEVQPSVVNFGLTAVGTTKHMTARVVAVGDDPCRVTDATLVNGDPAFTVTLPLLRTAFPGIGGVNIDIEYAPAASVPSSDLLEIDYAPIGGGTGGGTVSAGITGSAAEARICVNPPSLNFGTVSQGSSGMQTVTISSCGAVEVGLRGVILANRTGSPFSITTSPAVPQTIAAGLNATPQLSVTYSPLDAGPHFGAIEILSTDVQSPSITVPLSGNYAGNCNEILQCAPLQVAFGDTDIGTNKIVRVVCRSLGNNAVTVNSVTLGGAGPELSLIVQTPAIVQPGDAWTFDVRYAPAVLGPSSGTVTINSNACLAPPALPVTGNGIMQPLPPCQPPSTFSPVEQWSWHTTTYEPTYTNVWSTPLVANLTDDNADGRIDENDTPEIVFISFDTYSFTDPAASIPGVLRVLNGATGAEVFSVQQPRFADTSLLAIGDLDGDGSPEIVGSKWVQTPTGMGTGAIFGRYVTGTLVALDRLGNLLWESDPWSWPQEVSWNSSAPSIADLDGDGFAEIVLGHEVFDHRGHILWRGTGDAGMVAGGPHSIVADIDLDGHPEILAGGTAYRGDGSIMWDIPNIREGGNAVGMLDVLDPFPQIAMFTGSSMTVLDHLGLEKWSIAIPTSEPATQLPTIADFDGDGDGDIAIADGAAVYVYHGTGGLIWSSPVMDMTCCVGISAFDFEGDGIHELILTDYGTVYVYRGSDGTPIYQAPRPSVTAYEMPVVADIDNDGKGELVVALFGNGGTSNGIIAYSNVGDTWVGAPRIWNQQAFSVSNVYESGAIPRVQTPIPQGPNVFRGTIAGCR